MTLSHCVEPGLLAVAYSATDLSKLLKVSVRTVWSMLERGELPQPAIRSGRIVRWSAEAVMRWIRSGVVEEGRENRGAALGESGPSPN